MTEDVKIVKVGEISTFQYYYIHFYVRTNRQCLHNSI
jgi:hypothetical protein